jgi:hypothetical protein
MGDGTGTIKTLIDRKVLFLKHFRNGLELGQADFLSAIILAATVIFWL